MRPAAPALVVALLLASASPARAQSEAVGWLSPHVGGLAPRASYGFGDAADRPVHGRGGDLGVTRHDASLLLPLAQSEQDEWSLALRGRLDRVDTDVRLPDTGDDVPDDLWDLRAGLTYRHRFERGWIGALSVTAGSASDEPFASLDELVAGATALLRVPDGPANAWVAGLNYSNNRAFLNNVPLPLLGYWYQPSPDLLVLVGVPFALVRARPAAPVTLEAAWFLPARGRGRVSYEVVPRRVTLYTLLESDEVRYLRADRERRADALTLLDYRVAGGVRLGLPGGASLDLTAGYAFGRMLYEGEDFDERDRNRLNVGDGPYGGARLSVGF